MKLFPLAQSHTADVRETELKNLFMVLWQMLLENRADDVNVYGAPHLGSRDVLLKYLVSQNLTNFNAEALPADKARYLTMAWRYRNGKRGTHFLHTFIKMLWGNDFEITQLWQKKSVAYPLGLKSREEIEEIGEDIADYFLTSRLRVKLYGTQGYFPTEIAKSLNKVLPARLFVQEVLRDISNEMQLVWVIHSDIQSVHETETNTEIEEISLNSMQQWIVDTTFHSIT